MKKKVWYCGLPPGKYKTKAGSLVTISGKHGGAYGIEFEWMDEKGACLDCEPRVEDGWLVWDCDYHSSGEAKLEPEA